MLCNKGILAKFHEEVLQAILHTEYNRITLIWDANYNIVLVTKTIEAYFNIKLSDLLNENLSLVFPKQLVNQINYHFKNTSQTMKIPHPHQVNSTSENTLTHFSFTIKKTHIDNDAFYICTMEDVTEIQTIKNQLYSLEKAMLTAQMSANAVHEIRNPLTAIKGFLQLLEAGIDHREQYIQVLLSEVEKVEGLTNELLQMANPHKNSKKLVVINDLLSDVLLLIKAQPRMKQIQFEISGDSDVSIYCNPNEIKQALINLILNGADAMDSVGIIKIHIKSSEDDIKIKIIDQGHGMSEQIIEKINKEFYTTKEHGTGLGLVVTEQIIQKHGGILSVFSVENVGSTFEVILPLTDK